LYLYNIYMSKILIFGNQKGGTGKTICTMLTATALSQAPFSLKVCVIDLDHQKSFYDQREMDRVAYDQAAPPYEVIDMDIHQLQAQIKDLDLKFDVILMDTAGKLDTDKTAEHQEITKALMFADYLILPFVAGLYNVKATLKYLDVAMQLQTARQLSNRPLSLFGFMARFRPKARQTQYLQEDLAAITATTGLKVLETPLYEYLTYSDGDTYKSLFDINSKEPAKVNFASWLLEICKTINLIE
jgi:cellulose biosynthesis protein BcsQ